MSWRESVIGHGQRRTELTDILFVEKVTILLNQFFSLVPAAATGLRSTVPVRSATIGRPFRARTATIRGTSTSLRATTARTAAAASAAASGILFVLSKGSPNSEHMRAYSIL